MWQDETACDVENLVNFLAVQAEAARRRLDKILAIELIQLVYDVLDAERPIPT